MNARTIEKIKSIGSGICITAIVIGGVLGGLADSSSSTGSSSYSGDWSNYTDLGEYIVKTDESGAMPPLTKQQLKNAIDKCYSGEAHKNYISQLDSFISMQNKYKLNAAFAVCVAQTESTRRYWMGLY